MNQHKQKHILVADDEKNTLDTLGFVLESANYEVDLAKNGIEALVKIVSVKDSFHPVDLLVTDLNMPVLSGTELIDFLEKFYIDIPILIISSYDNSDLKEQRWKDKIIEFLTKPFGDQEFLAKIHNLLCKNIQIAH